MTSHHEMTRKTRRTRRALYVAAGSYVVLGSVVLAAALAARDWPGALLGIVIVLGALAIGVVCRNTLRLAERVVIMAESINELRRHVPSSQDNTVRTETRNAAESAEDILRTLDLATVGSGDPSDLVAATVKRSVFPRLVHEAREAHRNEPGTRSAT